MPVRRSKKISLAKVSQLHVPNKIALLLYELIRERDLRVPWLTYHCHFSVLLYSIENRCYLNNGKSITSTTEKGLERSYKDQGSSRKNFVDIFALLVSIPLSIFEHSRRLRLDFSQEVGADYLFQMQPVKI